MATSKSSTTAAKKTRSTGIPTPADVQEAFVKPLKGMAERLQNLPLAGAAGAIVESGRKDLQALVKANEKSYEGLQAVVQRQTEMLKTSIEEWQGTMKGLSAKDPREGFAKLDAMGKAAFKQALDDIRELSEMAAKSQSDAFEVVRERIRSNVDEVSKLLQPRK
ncbi:TIGR01841 family phasin [Variovorax sp. J31P179]|jgi:phasin family protein|uniref:phasin family protein n=1 Tax=Variovorax sp. J31P179 TaxID=3053508 RepID=UPI0025784E6C|nr:TIGR01841 family phasin [Variovorax sp. J31P179]MDM0081167.1 TIGR01841 family phasin [Variovorax sp. J31P179]HET7835135.1 TIGR01841 family phasin [Variovorax sp.]